MRKLLPRALSRYPAESKYLSPKHAGTHVLVAKSEFYYFGNAAIDLRSDLCHIMIKRQGSKCVSDEDIDKLTRQLSKYRKGKLGDPNNQAHRNSGMCRSRSRRNKSKRN